MKKYKRKLKLTLALTHKEQNSNQKKKQKKKEGKVMKFWLILKEKIDDEKTKWWKEVDWQSRIKMIKMKKSIEHQDQGSHEKFRQWKEEQKQDQECYLLKTE